MPFAEAVSIALGSSGKVSAVSVPSSMRLEHIPNSAPPRVRIISVAALAQMISILLLVAGIQRSAI